MTRPLARMPVGDRAHPIMRSLFIEMKRRNLSSDDMAKLSGFAANSIRNWHRGARQPSIGATEVFANTLGYDLVLVKRT